jgi:UDP-glucose 4-epimerase
VGQHLAADLAKAGIKAKGTTRRPGPLSESVDWYTISSGTDRAALRRAVDGVDTVFHLAARVHIPQSRLFDELDEYRRTNCEATSTLLHECAAAGVRRFIFASTVKVMGPYNGTPFTEEMIPDPEDAYAQSKLESESIVREVASRHSIDFVILRFPVIYGSHMKANMLRLFEAISSGMPLPFRGVSNTRSVLYVENAVAALRHVAATEAAKGETFFISDGTDYSTEELVRLIAAAMKTSPRLFKVPSALLRGTARLGDIVSGVIPFPISSGIMARMFGSLTVDDSRIRRLTQFENRFTTSEGIARTAIWFLQRKLSG